MLRVRLSLAVPTIADRATAINALVKSKKEKAEIIENLPERTTLEINTNGPLLLPLAESPVSDPISDASTAGTVIAVVCVLISVLSLIYMVLLLLPGIPSSNSAPRRLSTKTLPIQWISLAFLSLWLFTVQIPFTYFFRTRSVGVRAFIGRIELSEQLVKTLQKALGISTRYKDKNYCKYVDF